MSGWRGLVRSSWLRTTTCRRAYSLTPLSDTLAFVHDPPFVRRAVFVTGLPRTLTLQQFVASVRSGPLEYVNFINGATAEVSFLDGRAAAAFASNFNFSCTWLPYRPLDPVVASAVAQDGARRSLLLFKSQERTDDWTPDDLHTILEPCGEIESLHVLKVDNTELPYREVASVHFADIASAIRAHARVRAGPFTAQVQVAYTTDPCEGLPPPDIDAAFRQEPRHPPVYFPSVFRPTQPIPLTPYTTFCIYRISPQITLRYLIQRLSGGMVDFGSGVSSVEWGPPVAGETARNAILTFFRPEDARDFYLSQLMRPYGLRIDGMRLFVRPVPHPRVPGLDVPVNRPKSLPARSLLARLATQSVPAEAPAAPQRVSRTLRLRPNLPTRLPGPHFAPDTLRRPGHELTLDKLRRDFGAFGELVHVWLDAPNVGGSSAVSTVASGIDASEDPSATTRHRPLIRSARCGYVEFARAADARTALENIALERPEYWAGCAMGFWFREGERP
ncbi:hypothetical protein C8J57DRAFT_191914 [Mycena rebaudengoi]|nr:hypothetical protein C8J57DRAFT_191914 [Mycena rebaudengoi]